MMELFQLFLVLDGVPLFDVLSLFDRTHPITGYPSPSCIDWVVVKTAVIRSIGLQIPGGFIN